MLRRSSASRLFISKPHLKYILALQAWIITISMYFQVESVIVNDVFGDSSSEEWLDVSDSDEECRTGGGGMYTNDDSLDLVSHFKLYN